MNKLTEQAKQRAMALGANVVGVAGADGYRAAPEGHRPEDVMQGATCVVSMGFLQPRAVIDKAMPTQYTRSIFTVAGVADQTAYLFALWLEDQGYEAIPVSARGMYMDALVGEFRGDLSHKHTAMLAGLGEIGMNSLLINPKFGNRLFLVSVVTNAPLTPDRPFAEALCGRQECLLCVKACPVRAILPDGRVDKIRCAKYYRPYEDLYKETWGVYFCHECRRICPA
jgi:epoxyqueuosine reductase